MLLSACGANETIAPAAPRVLTVGVVQSLSGTAAVYGKAVVEGIDLAVRQLNAGTAQSGVQILLTVVDDAGASAPSTAAFATLVSRKVDVLIGPTLSNLAAADHGASAAEDHRLSRR